MRALPRSLRENGALTRELAPRNDHFEAGRVLAVHLLKATVDEPGLVVTLTQQPHSSPDAKTLPLTFTKHQIVVTARFTELDTTALVKDKNNRAVLPRQSLERYSSTPLPVEGEVYDIVASYGPTLRASTPREATYLLDQSEVISAALAESSDDWM